MRCAAQGCAEEWTHEDWKLCGHAVRFYGVARRAPDARRQRSKFAIIYYSNVACER